MFAEDTVATFTGPPIGPIGRRTALAETYAEHLLVADDARPRSRATRLRRHRSVRVADAPTTAALAVLRDDKLVAMDVTLDATAAA